MSWRAFLRAPWEAIASADFLTVEVLTLHGLKRYFVFFVMELKTRRVHIAGIVHQPQGAWTMQVGRNLLDASEGLLVDMRYLILDRAPVYTRQFRSLLRDSGLTTDDLAVAGAQPEPKCERRRVRKVDSPGAVAGDPPAHPIAQLMLGRLYVHTGEATKARPLLEMVRHDSSLSQADRDEAALLLQAPQP